jgi:hypothetical protein
LRVAAAELHARLTRWSEAFAKQRFAGAGVRMNAVQTVPQPVFQFIGRPEYSRLRREAITRSMWHPSPPSNSAFASVHGGDSRDGRPATTP